MCPGIDAIDADTFQYIFTNKTMVGYFDWNLDFKWYAKNDFSWEIYDMPAMSGGLFAIDKKFFETLGFYDPGKFPAPKLTLYISITDLTFNAHCRTFYQAFLLTQNQQPAHLKVFKSCGQLSKSSSKIAKF